MSSTQKVRIEEDLLGVVEVPLSAYYGAQTQRARDNFPLNGEKTLGDYPVLVDALLWVKKASAQANAKTGYLSDEHVKAICVAIGSIRMIMLIFINPLMTYTQQPVISL
jgi:aspartate ammonia-lyase